MCVGGGGCNELHVDQAPCCPIGSSVADAMFRQQGDPLRISEVIGFNIFGNKPKELCVICDISVPTVFLPRYRFLGGHALKHQLSDGCFLFTFFTRFMGLYVNLSTADSGMRPQQLAAFAA